MRRDIIRLLIGATLISFTGVLVKLAHLGPTNIGFYRMLSGGLMLLVILAVTRIRNPKSPSSRTSHLAPRTILLSALAGIIFALDLSFWHRSVLWVGVGLSTMLVSLQVFFVAAFGLVFLKERLTPRLAVATFLALAGMALVVRFDPDRAAPRYGLGVLFGLVPAICYAAYILILRRVETGAGPQATDAIGSIGYGGAIDLGATGTFAEGLTAGFAARHIGSMTFGDGFERLPIEFALGGAYSLNGMFVPDEPASAWKLNFTLDAVAPALDNNPNVRAGVEFVPIKYLALRAGYRTGPVSLGSLGYENGLTGGLGVTVGNFGLDYAFVPYGELGLTHRVGLRFEVPPPTTGALCVVVLDAETRERLAASIAVTGAVDTTALADEVLVSRAAPGSVQVRASLEGYEPDSRNLWVVEGERTTDTLYLKQVLGSIVGGIYDAKTKQPIGGKLVYSGPKSGQLGVPATPGTFEVKGVKAGSYTLDASGPTGEYLAQTATVEVPAGQTVKHDFYLWKKGDLLYLMVNFETGKANILPEFNSDIDRAGAIIKQTPQIKKIELAGHTDPRYIKTVEFPSNQELSEARAEAVKRYMVEKFGIDPSRLLTKGYADTKPLVPNTSPGNMYKNRRTELRIIE